MGRLGPDGSRSKRWPTWTGGRGGAAPAAAAPVEGRWREERKGEERGADVAASRASSRPGVKGCLVWNGRVCVSHHVQISFHRHHIYHAMQSNRPYRGEVCGGGGLAALKTTGVSRPAPSSQLCCGCCCCSCCGGCACSLLPAVAPLSSRAAAAAVATSTPFDGSWGGGDGAGVASACLPSCSCSCSGSCSGSAAGGRRRRRAAHGAPLSRAPNSRASRR